MNRASIRAVVVVCSVVGPGMVGCKGKASGADGGSVTSASASSDAAVAAAPAPGTAEVHDFKVFPSGPVKTHYFVGEMVLTSTTPAFHPSFKIVFKDADGTVVDSATCSFQGTLEPGTKAPCYGEIFKAPKWASYDVTFNKISTPAKPAPSTLTVSETKLLGHVVEGKVSNTGAATVKGVMAYVSLYGSDGKIVGASNAWVAGNDIDPSGSAKFSVKVAEVDGTASTFAVVTSP